MSYIKDRFLDSVYKATSVGAYYEKGAKAKLRKEALDKIVSAYNDNPELENFLICKRLVEIVKNGTVGEKVIIARWNQLAGILDHYRHGSITDIGLVASVARFQKDETGATISGQSFFIQDHGDGRIEIASSGIPKTEVENALAGIESSLPREKIFAAIPVALEKLNTAEATFYTEINEYLFINGQTDNRLLKLSPNSFCNEDFYNDEDGRPEELQHFYELLSHLTSDQLGRLIKNCGLEDSTTKDMAREYKNEEDADKKQFALQCLKNRLWDADREDFYREYDLLKNQKVTK